MSDKQGFYWERHAEVEKMFLEHIEMFKEKNIGIGKFEEKLAKKTNTKLLDWVDHIVLPRTDEIIQHLGALGFTRQMGTESEAYIHPGVLLPSVVVADTSIGESPGLAIRAESIADFLQVNNVDAEICGRPLSLFRQAAISTENGVTISVVVRRGSSDYRPTETIHFVEDYIEAVELWKSVPRAVDDDQQALGAVLDTARKIVADFDRNQAAHIVCSAERDYWMSRNYAGRLQKSQQDSMGLGWANHDHHTFRSSRRHFQKLIELFTLLGFQKRERFYAGKEAGWGAQVMENSEAGLALFLDVDLDPHEVDMDFSSQLLEEKEHLGTIGLWCALHGDSILKAGMHHLAGRFQFHELSKDMLQFNVQFMAPFSDFSYLKQAFSVPEKWEVNKEKVEKLLQEKQITDTQAEKFIESGAVGSHLENIERREGYKGFNKNNVSAIIRDTDPRKDSEL